MNIKSILRDLIEKDPLLSQNKIAPQVGLSPQSMSARMNARDLKFEFVARVLGVLRYDLVVVPRDPNRRLPKGSIVVTVEEG